MSVTPSLVWSDRERLDVETNLPRSLAPRTVQHRVDLLFTIAQEYTQDIKTQFSGCFPVLPPSP
jgi:hypothetical protein